MWRKVLNQSSNETYDEVNLTQTHAPVVDVAQQLIAIFIIRFSWRLFTELKFTHCNVTAKVQARQEKKN